MSLPLIGIVCCNRRLSEEPAHAVMDRYIRAVLGFSGCGALLIPASQQGFDPVGITSRLDGLMLTGSPSNVRPGLYGEAEGDIELFGPFDHDRDHVSLRMIETMVAAAKPVFGICRGFQEINVALGGTLRRDVGFSASKGGGSVDHHAADDTDFDALFDHYHSVDLTPGGVLNKAVNKKALMVTSVHYQGVGKLAPDLAVEAVAPDGQIEAFSANISGAPVVGVQWHPEWHVEAHPDSQAFFRLMGEAMRGRPLQRQTPHHPKL